MARIVPCSNRVDASTAPPATPSEHEDSPGLADAIFAPFRDAWLAGRARFTILIALGPEAGDIAVEAFRSNVVLHGDVGSRDASERAERAVRALPGIVGVSNRTRVRGARAPRIGGTDAEVRAGVTARLREARALRGSIVTVEVYDGVVRLTGVARDPIAATTAFELALAVPGVRRVINDVVPYSASTADDADAA